MRKLCSHDEISENSAQEFETSGSERFFVVRKNGHFYGYINNCPHAGWPLNLAPNTFLDLDKNYIQCANHMALFEISSGTCVAGPCAGDRLKKVDIAVSNGSLWVAD